SGRRRHTRFSRDWSSDVCSSDLSIPNHQDVARFDVADVHPGESFLDLGAQRRGDHHPEVLHQVAKKDALVGVVPDQIASRATLGDRKSVVKGRSGEAGAALELTE